MSKQCRVYDKNEWHWGPTGLPEQEGVRDADFVLYVSALTTERCGHENIIAYAAYCQLEAEMDRQVFVLVQTLFLNETFEFFNCLDMEFVCLSCIVWQSGSHCWNWQALYLSKTTNQSNSG